jgi:hypothetical protein
MAGFGQVFERGVGIFAPSRFAGVYEMALPIAAIIKGEDVQPEGMEARKSIHCVPKIAVCPVQIDGGVTRLRRRGNPPAA